MSLQIGLLVSSDVWSDLVIYSAVSHYRFWYLPVFIFSASYVYGLPWHSVHHPLPQMM